MDFFLFVWIFFSIVLEVFPISSSGHMILIDRFFDAYNLLSINLSSLDYFDHLMHGPTALVVALFFYKRWWFLLRNIKRTLPIILKIFFLGIITESVTVFFYALFSFVNLNKVPMYIGFFVTGSLLASLYFCHRKTANPWNPYSALLIGAVQGLALIPGISRFGATFVATRWLGGSNKKAFELSFLLEWPVSVAAFLKGLWHLHKMHNVFLPVAFASSSLIILISCLVALSCFMVVYRMVLNNTLWRFSGYVFLVACISLIFGW